MNDKIEALKEEITAEELRRFIFSTYIEPNPLRTVRASAEVIDGEEKYYMGTRLKQVIFREDLDDLLDLQVKSILSKYRVTLKEKPDDI